MGSVLPEDSPLASAETNAGDSAEFDLTSEANEERHADRVIVGPFIAVYAGGGGIFAILGVAWSLGFQGGSPNATSVGFIVVGLAVLAAGTYAIRWLGSNVAVRVRVGPAALTFYRRNGKTLSLNWTDPTFRVDLCTLEGDARAILPTGDARAIRPIWIDVFGPKHNTVHLETTLPREAADAITEQAGRMQLRVERTRVAYFWQSAPKSPGWLSWEEPGALTASHTLNGELIKLRGSKAQPGP